MNIVDSTYTVTACALVAGAYAAVMCRKKHNRDNRETRRCKTCGKDTVRKYQMIHDPGDYVESRWERHYQWHAFDVCTNTEKCGTVWHTKWGEKWFSLFKLGWRHITDPSQFVRDETLFERAGLIPKAMPSLPERMRENALAYDKRFERLRGKGPSRHVILPKNTHRIPVS